MFLLIESSTRSGNLPESSFPPLAYTLDPSVRSEPPTRRLGGAEEEEKVWESKTGSRGPGGGESLCTSVLGPNCPYR